MERLSRDEFVQNLRDSDLFSRDELKRVLDAVAEPRPPDGNAMAQRLIDQGALTPFQAVAVSEARFEELVIGNYQVIQRLGAGGMGTVYKARHRRMNRIVAIKVLSRGDDLSDTFVKRFQREVEAVARLSHPNIVMAHDADEAAIGPYLVMEFIDGQDLESAVNKQGPMAVAEAVRCILQGARALHYAHLQGITHRDIKPANLLRDVSGVVKVADLGLARCNDAIGRPAEVSVLTQTNMVMGTVDFMSPEQTQGLSNVDHRADIYSLGCTLHYLLTGHPPFRGSLLEILLKHREAPTPSLTAARADVPKALDDIFQRMMAKRLEDRFDSMADVIRALEGLSIEAAPETKPAVAAEDASQRLRSTHPLAALLVEPSRSQAVIIWSYLRKLGFTDSPTMSSGTMALEVARTSKPDVVISSMHLSDMTGVQFAQSLRAVKHLASVGFILISSAADAPQADLLGRDGNTVHLPKPFDFDQLAQAVSATTGRSAATKPSTARVRDIRVLVVDDSSAARVHLREVLTGLGVRHIVEAVDGLDAVMLMGKDTYDLVVTDYTMPRLGGRGLLDFIRHRSTTPSVPVILVTTETDPAKLDPVRQLGVAAICDKSFEPDVVRRVLQTLG
jgi:serine/threonine protein kinase